MAAQIAASTGSASLLLLGSGSATSSSIHAIKSARSMPTKYGSYCVRSTHGFTSLRSPSWIVLCARLSTFSHARSMASPTRAYAASPSTGAVPAPSPSWLGGWTSKYCDP
ncbi:hypothetical protein CC86DRAFT_387895 [Ophiobolus disseminans]|uniref:REJ domain-containing protein n=1 Tax=Ophiobolus disseminans TaxID=1469910 RepID=A0A6A6ZGN0_9PLEO|nr:hypothetical protein CC86DRAFT_387895 [Ophiobolus disseminans]